MQARERARLVVREISLTKFVRAACVCVGNRVSVRSVEVSVWVCLIGEFGRMLGMLLRKRLVVVDFSLVWKKVFCSDR